MSWANPPHSPYFSVVNLKDANFGIFGSSKKKNNSNNDNKNNNNNKITKIVAKLTFSIFFIRGTIRFTLLIEKFLGKWRFQNYQIEKPKAKELQNNWLSLWIGSKHHLFEDTNVKITRPNDRSVVVFDMHIHHAEEAYRNLHKPWLNCACLP